MYKLTFWDENLPSFCSGIYSVYADNIEKFEKEWVKLVKNEERIADFYRSKAGELVTEYYPTPNDAELNIVQKDDASKILVEMQNTIENRIVTVHNGFDYPAIFWIKKMDIYCRYVKYENMYLRLMSFCIKGIAEEKNKEKKYQKVGLYGNPMLKYKGKKSMPNFYRSDEFEEYEEECIESIAWYPMGEASTLEVLQECYGTERIELTDIELDLLLCDMTCC